MLDTADRLALHELAALYGDLIDARDFASLDRVFVADVVWGNPALPGRDLVGIEAIRTFMSRSRHPLAHHITNVRVEESGDDVLVHSRVLLPGDDGTVRSGEYHDVAVRTDDGWRVRHRTFSARVRPDTDPPAPAPR